MHKDIAELFDGVKNVAEADGLTPSRVLWASISMGMCRPFGSASVAGRANIARVYTGFRRRFDTDLTQKQFRNELIALCKIIGLRTEKQGGKHFVLMPEPVHGHKVAS